MNPWGIVLAAASPERSENFGVLKELAAIPFFEVYLSTFLGFLSALVVEAIRDHISSRAKKKQ